MDRNCDAFIRSNNTYDILIARESLEISDDRAECIQNIGEKFVAEYFDRDEVPQLSIKTYGYSIIPKCFGLLDTLALETTGILQLQNQPALSLRGQGIFIGFVDTGISYELPCFRNADGSTRIRSIWDQSIPTGEKNTPQGFLYGTEYTQKEINEALEQEHPRELVPVTDEDGHGTMLASIACGSEDLQAGFTGAAPYAELLVVKLKPAKPYLKDFFYIPQEFYHFTQKAQKEKPGVLKTQQEEVWKKELKRAKKNSDYVIAYVHWGTEGKIHYGQDQTEIADLCVKAGADAVIGGHPHRLQGVEFIKNVPVAYSVGNFWFSTGKLYTTIAQIQIDGSGSLKLRMIPCIQDSLTTSILTEKKQIKAFYHYLADISNHVGIDEDGFFYPYKNVEKPGVSPYAYTSGRRYGQYFDDVDLDLKSIDIVGNLQ